VGIWNPKATPSTATTIHIRAVLPGTSLSAGSVDISGNVDPN
jgi:hypothetical protein